MNFAIKATEWSAIRVNFFCHCWSTFAKISHRSWTRAWFKRLLLAPLLCLHTLHTDGMDAQSLTSCPEHPLLAPSLPLLQSVCAGRRQNLDQGLSLSIWKAPEGPAAAEVSTPLPFPWKDSGSKGRTVCGEKYGRRKEIWQQQEDKNFRSGEKTLLESVSGGVKEANRDLGVGSNL